MKLLLLTLILITTLHGKQLQHEIFGKWKIMKVETKNNILIPTKDFTLTIEANRLHFNRDVNGCSANPILTDTTIDFYSELCTRICCDGQLDPIGGMDLYRGSYVATEKTLVISNGEVKTYLEKISNK
jgi:hypothetical protein